MLEHTLEQITQTENYFTSQGYHLVEQTIGERNLRYYILPQNLNEDLPDFVLRLSNKERYLIGIADTVPENLRPYFVLEEYIEFTEKGISAPNRVIDSEKEVLTFIPKELKRKYIERRISLFEKELELDLIEPDKYCLGEGGRIEFINNLIYLKEELGKR